MNITDGTVARNGLRLAVRDYGGAGHPVVLLPGAGRTVVDLTPLAERLIRQHRVVAMDHRNHGLSGDADWSFDEVVADVRAVAEHFGFDRTAIVGHSLGGMVAAMYAIAHPDQTSAVVNLDGHGFGAADQYLGIDPAVVEQRMGQLQALIDQLSAKPAMTADQLTDAYAGYEQEMSALGMPAVLAREAFHRALAKLPDGTFRTRPLPERGSRMMEQVAALKMFDLWERTPRPILIYNATKPDPWMLAAPPELSWIADFMGAYRSGLDRDLSALAQRKPSVKVIKLDATHGLIFERTELIAEQITGFLADAACS